MTTSHQDVELADQMAATAEKLYEEIGKVIVGQKNVIELLLISIFCDGHALLVGVPGLAKTMLVQTLSQCLSLQESRIQFTPDLMPSDIIGAETMDKERNFRFVKGPIFANVILADEINRTPPKTQSALLEAMQEKAVTVGGQRYALQVPFFVLATQNPIEQEGTYRLPEAQLDRFLFKIDVDYPSLEDEVQILIDNHKRLDIMDFDSIKPILSAESIANYQNLIKQIIVEDNLLRYIASIIHNTRNNANLYLGASPRASIAILNAAKANAAIHGRDFVTPEDIKRCTKAVLKHRLVLTPEREMEAFTVDKVVDQILETIEIPR
jgi:MoxR-like ATPase